MQKVESSSLFSRFVRKPRNRGASLFLGRIVVRPSGPALPIGATRTPLGANRHRPSYRARIPRRLAELALTAWKRDEHEGPLDPENFEQRVQRHRTATFALIGLSIESVGRWNADEVVLDLHVALIGTALDASEWSPSR
jgi:hypothetical protein